MNCRRLAQGTSLYYHPWGGGLGGEDIWGDRMVFRGNRVGGVGFEGFWGITWFSGGTEGDQSSLTTGKRVTIES